MLQGMTAHYLSHSTFPLKAGDTALVHAGAGGVGLLLTQMAARLGARVITTVSTADKAELSREAGASDVILYTEQDFEAEVKRLTGGKGVDVVYDSVGKTTFEGSLNCLRPRGLLALFGASSGPVPPFDLIQLSSKGSLFITRPTLWHYVATRAELEWRAGDVLGWAAKGELKLRTEYVYPLPRPRRRRPTWKTAKRRGRFCWSRESSGQGIVDSEQWCPCYRSNKVNGNESAVRNKNGRTLQGTIPEKIHCSCNFKNRVGNLRA